MIACLFDPGPCIAASWDGALASISALVEAYVPFGWYGLVFILGMIVGERIGIVGIIGAIVLAIASRFYKPGHGAVETDEIYPDPDKPVRKSGGVRTKPAGKKYLLDEIRERLSGKR